jgi:hypothetical protein
MYRDFYSSWMRTGLDAWSLGIESASVVGLRMSKIAAGGDAASKESMLMVSEKVQASIELQIGMATGAFGMTPLAGTQKALRHYRRKVAANKRRLGR